MNADPTATRGREPHSMKRFLATLAVLPSLLLLAACGGKEPTPPEPQIVGVILSPTTLRFEFLGESKSLTAGVYRDNGGQVTGATITWSSSDESVVRVTQEGLATAAGAGDATITARYQEWSAQADVVVSTPDCVTPVDLNPGEWEVVSIGCPLRIPAGSAGDRWRVAIVNEDVERDSELSTSVKVGVAPVNPSGAPPALLRAPEARGPVAPRRSLVSPAAIARADRSTRILESTYAEHLRLRQDEIDLWERLRPDIDGMLERKRIEARTAALRSAAAASPARITYRENPSSSCTANPERAAFLVAENDHLAIYQDSTLGASPATEITLGQAQRLLDYYDTWGESTIQSHFQGFPDLDGNGKILAISAFTTSLTNGNRAAYVNGLDLFPREDCATSNEAELMYLNAAVIRTLDTDLDFALEIPVHEAKHIASFWQGLRRSVRANASLFHPPWFEEGSAEIASEVAGRKAWASVGGPAPNERVTDTWIYETSVDESGEDFKEEFAPTYARLISAHRYLTSQPNGLMVTPFAAREGSSIYGSGWTFLRWLGDTYGGAATSPGGDAAFFRTLNDSLSAPAPKGIEDAVGKPFERILEEFAAAAMFHMEASAPSGLDYRLYDFVSSLEAFCYAADNPPCEGVTNAPAGTWPWPVTTLSDGTMAAPFGLATYNGSIGYTGIRIHEFVSQGTDAIQIQVEAQQPVRLVVVRLN